MSKESCAKPSFDVRAVIISTCTGETGAFAGNPGRIVSWKMLRMLAAQRNFGTLAADMYLKGMTGIYGTYNEQLWPYVEILGADPAGRYDGALHGPL